MQRVCGQCCMQRVCRQCCMQRVCRQCCMHAVCSWLACCIALSRVMLMSMLLPLIKHFIPWRVHSYLRIESRRVTILGTRQFHEPRMHVLRRNSREHRQPKQLSEAACSGATLNVSISVLL
jgi:hypothetical protein